MDSNETTAGELQFTLTETLSAGERNHIHERIKAFSDGVSRHHRDARSVGARPLDILVRDDSDDEIVAGLIASTYWGWFDIDDLWVIDGLRGHGIGRRLLRMAEAEAQARGCSRARLRTFSFQARGFYQKEGYRVVGALEDYPPGEVFYWMRKDW